LLKNCDTLFLVGTNFPYPEFLPEEGQARAVQIDLDAANVGLRHPVEAPVIGDARAALEALLPRLKARPTRWRDEVGAQIEASRRLLAEHAGLPAASGLNPRAAFAGLAERLPERLVVTADCGSSTVWAARYLPMSRGMSFILSGTLATMGGSLPYASGAKVAFPDRPVLAVVGDGAMLMNGNEQLAWIAGHWTEWSDPRLVVVVLNNQDLNYVTWEQRAQDGNRRFDASQQLPDFPFSGYARLLGLDGRRVENPADLGAALNAALAADRPFVLELMTDPDVPPLPPSLKPAQREKLGRALAEGDSRAASAREQLRASGYED
ncbi:MAG TPA: thiamine pyrophosphate-dependent enzyme, partial [Deinococcales bacterium]|nr:thiamine pyrophosphate-dependent enzyme [Deinococcales bacterium]